MARITAAIIAASLLVPTAGMAADWRYCLAPSSGNQLVYMTDMFTSDADLAAIEADFAEALREAGLAYDEVQCPRAHDKESLERMKDYAMTINSKAGRKIIALRWPPHAPQSGVLAPQPIRN